MLSAARARGKGRGLCPTCSFQILSLFESAGPTTPRLELRQRLVRSIASSSRPPRSASRNNPRKFRPSKNNSRDVHRDVQRDVQPDPKPPAPEDIEIVVRQAKHAFGNTLPKGYLNEEEYKLYERLYGAPLRETQPEDVGMPVIEDIPEDGVSGASNQRILLRETDDGGVEEVAYYTDEPPAPANVEGDAELLKETSPGYVETIDELPSDAGLTYISAVAKNQREYNALLKLQKDFERSSLQQQLEQKAIEEEDEIDEEEEFDEDEEEEDEGEPDATFHSERVHGYTKLAQWRTFPSTLQLPHINFVMPITELLNRTDIKHVKEAAEKAFGGPGLPDSVATPQSKRNAPQNAVGMEAGHHRMNEIEADAYIATNLPGMYASTMSVLVEIRKRLGVEWMQSLMTRNNGEGPRVLDAGAGGGGLAAWQEVLQAEWDLIENGGKKLRSETPGKMTVVVGSDHLRHRISRFLHNTTFLPRLPDYLHSGSHPSKLDGGESHLPRKQFDIIIASHLLMPLKEGFKRNALIDNLWEMLSPEGGILIVTEKGHPRGFEAVADVRSRLLKEFIISPTSDPQIQPQPQPEVIPPSEGGPRREREQGSIIAPCTNHKACPMYLTPGLSPGRKDFCRFSQRFIRPPFLQRVLSATHRNHEDVDFSFVAIQRGSSSTSSSPPPPPHLEGYASASAPFTQSSNNNNSDIPTQAFNGYENSADPPNPLSLPRNILPPLKRRGHVTLDLCTPAGMIERWIVPKSFSRQAYHDARKTRWGDLWALGAKTRVVRPIRLGRGGAVGGDADADAVATGVPNDGGVRAREALRGKKKRVINLNADAGGIFSASETGSGKGIRGKKIKGIRKGGAFGMERRTKGGKKPKARRNSEDGMGEWGLGLGLSRDGNRDGDWIRG